MMEDTHNCSLSTSASESAQENENKYGTEARKDGNSNYSTSFYSKSFQCVETPTMKYPSGSFSSYNTKNYEGPTKAVPFNSGFPDITLTRMSNKGEEHCSQLTLVKRTADVGQHAQVHSDQCQSGSFEQISEIESDIHRHQAIDMRKSIDKVFWLSQSTIPGLPQGPRALPVTAESLMPTLSPTSSRSSLIQLSPLSPTAPQYTPASVNNFTQYSNTISVVQANYRKINFTEDITMAMTNPHQLTTEDNQNAKEIENVTESQHLQWQVMHEVPYSKQHDMQKGHCNQQNSEEMTSFDESTTEVVHFNQEANAASSTHETEATNTSIHSPSSYSDKTISSTNKTICLQKMQNIKSRRNLSSETDVHQSINKERTTEVQQSYKEATYKSGREAVLKPIKTKVLKYKDGRKRTFMILHKSSFESMQDKGLIQAVKSSGNGHFHRVSREEIESSKTLLPRHRPQDIEKIQFTNIFQPENLESELLVPPFDNIVSVRKLPLIENCEPKYSSRITDRSHKQSTLDIPVYSPPSAEECENFSSKENQTPVLVTWSVTSVTDSPALTFTVKLPTSMKESTFTTHITNQNIIFSSGTSQLPKSIPQNPYSTTEASLPTSYSETITINKTSLRKLGQDFPYCSQLGCFPYDNLSPSSVNYSSDQDLGCNTNGGVKESRNYAAKSLNLDTVAGLEPNNFRSLPRLNELNQTAETARSHFKEFEATKLKMKHKYRQLLVKHQRKYKALANKVKDLEKTSTVVRDAGSREQVLRDAKKYLSEEHALFLESQMFLHNRDGKGNRFSKKFLQYLVSLYEKSPAGYRFLRTIFTIPSVRTIHKWQNCSSGGNAKYSANKYVDPLEASNIYKDLGSFSDLLQVEALHGHEQRESSYISEFQSLTSMPPTEPYESDGSFYWQNSYPGDVCQQYQQSSGQEQLKSICETEYIQSGSSTDNSYMLIHL